MSSSASKSRDKSLTANIVAGAVELGVEQERKRCDRIVCEEWQRIVKEFNLRPGSVTEKFMGRVINRIRGIE